MTAVIMINFLYMDLICIECALGIPYIWSDNLCEYSICVEFEWQINKILKIEGVQDQFKAISKEFTGFHQFKICRFSSILIYKLQLLYLTKTLHIFPFLMNRKTGDSRFSKISELILYIYLFLLNKPKIFEIMITR